MSQTLQNTILRIRKATSTVLRVSVYFLDKLSDECVLGCDGHTFRIACRDGGRKRMVAEVMS